MTTDYKDEWRQLIQCPVHPFADMFPMIEGKILDEKVKDIRANGVKLPVLFWAHYDGDGNVVERWFIDGRNRLRAAELAGIPFDDVLQETVTCDTPIAWIMRLNLHRRQLSKEEWADLIVKGTEAEQEALRLKQAEDIEAYLAKLDDRQPVSETHKGGRGKRNPVRQAAVAAGRAAGISESTVKASLRKREAEKQGKTLPKRDRNRHTRTTAPELPGAWLLGAVDMIVTACDALKVEKLADAPHPHRGQALDELRECNAKIDTVIKKLESLKKADQAAIAKASDGGNGEHKVKAKAKVNGRHVTA
jgi:hypothetical protein